MVLYYFIAALTCVVAILCGLLTRRRGERFRRRAAKGAALVLAMVFASRSLGGEIALIKTIGLNISSPFGPSGSVYSLLSVLVLWSSVAAALLLCTYPFYVKDVPTLRHLVSFFATAVYAIAFITLFFVPRALDADAALTYAPRDVIYAVEIGLGLGLAFLFPRYVPATERGARLSVRKILFGALGCLLATCPIYTIQVLYGYAPADMKFLDLTIEHRLMIYGALVVPILIHFALRGLKAENRHYALLFLSLGTMISFSLRYSFASFADVRSWPLHLCNTAMYIVPVCLLLKSEKVYYFTLFINVLGALFAMLMPNTADNLNIFAAKSIEFWLNHYCAFFLPILIMSLRIFKRPKFRQFFYATVAFTIYFVLTLFVNAWFGDTDFFFINSDFIADKLGQWAKNLRDATASFTIAGHEMTFYPVYQTLFYLAYDVLALAVWFVYEQFFEITDLYTEMMRRNKKIKVDRLALEVALGGRSVKEPVNMDGVNKLILKNFSKKYSTSDVYAVNGADLEVEGGQIFGFLGPNGAGKSTIIKSVVGIQTITSGNIEVCGYDVEKQSVEAKMQIGFVPDHYALYENLTGREYINYIADLYGVGEQERTERIREYVERFHLVGAFDNQIKTYSHGMKQKITIMSALVHEPKLWILDEPLTGLDPESIFQVKECMKAHAKKGNIVFFSSHIIDVVERICDRIAIIRKGEILFRGTIAEIEASGESLEAFYMRMIGESGEEPTAILAAPAAEKRVADA